MPLISALGRWKQVDMPEFEASHFYIVSSIQARQPRLQTERDPVSLKKKNHSDHWMEKWRCWEKGGSREENQKKLL